MTSPPRIPSSALRTIELIHAQGGIAVAAHPFHPIRGAARGYRSIGRMVADLPLDAIEVVNNAGFVSRLYDAWAALRNVRALRRAVAAGHTRAEVTWSWTAGKVPRHLRLQLRAGLRFLRQTHDRRGGHDESHGRELPLARAR